MGLLDEFKYKNVFRGVCSVDRESSTQDRLVIKCNPEKIVGDKTFTGRGEVEAIVEDRGRKIIITDDGGLPAPMIDEVKEYLKKNLKG